ncbi:unnamed protein product [Orchesella dallaii]|uniref:Exocyst complex component EXOC6/Sec15 N-terminal domain-containing protein n=1 Tax=Orchesella dallaii TaxID=48710 RepID=A0ABP1QKN2_9HEXA
MGTNAGPEWQHFEQLTQDIEILRTCLGLIFRSVIEDGKDQKFLEHLEKRIRGHDNDIKKLCSAHYQGFVDSIMELENVRSEAQDLKVGLSSDTYSFKLH